MTLKSKNLTSFDPRNGELRTRPEHFRQHGKGILSMRFRPEIRRGHPLAEGAFIADIQWDDGSITPLRAAPGARGVIRRVNKRLRYEALASSPSDLLLTLDTEA